MNFIDSERELATSDYLISSLVMSGWMGKGVTIVNCSPEYSSRLTQLVNHKTCYLNRNEPYEQISLEFPKKGMNQVWCYDESEYIPFDRYLLFWIKKHICPEGKYLFITNSIFTGKNLNKVRLSMKSKLDNIDNMKFATLFTQDDALIMPDFIGRLFKQDQPPVFFWENKNK